MTRPRKSPRRPASPKWTFPLLLAGLASAAMPAGAVDLRYEPISDRGTVVDIRHAGDGSDRLFLVEQAGRVWMLRDEQGPEQLFLDIRGRVRVGGERGLLSLAFAPDHASSGRFYTWYTNEDGDTVLSRFRVSADPDRGDENSEEILLTVPQPRSNHNGGQLRFGPDGYLYLGIGDGGGAGDPFEAGQDLDTLLGSLIRIDVSTATGYAIPPDNPRVGRPGRDELWAWGLRNPWRMAFDDTTGDLYIADVGQNDYEEVNHLEAGEGGQNFGWNRMEGEECFVPGCDTTGLTLPVAGYSHAQGCSITGGVVYRGQAYPDLHGRFFYGDYCTGRIWGVSRNGAQFDSAFLDNSSFSILTFGSGEDGTVYLSAGGDGVYRLSDGPRVEEPTFELNPGLNDAWYDPATSGQGFFINVFPGQGEGGLVFLAWFTFDAVRPGDDVAAVLGGAGQRWFTAIGAYEGGRSTLELSVTRGGRFDRAMPQPATETVGSLELEFTGCNRAIVRYDLPDAGLSGEIELRRVVSDNVALCEALLGGTAP